MEKYNLIQTGEEVQRILNEAVPQSEITAEVERAQGAEQTLQDNIDAEELRAKAAEHDLEQADTVLQGNIEAEELRAKAAEKQNADDIDVIEEKIPTEASSSNKLADKAFVNSSIASNTATYRGSFNQVNDLHLTLEATEADIATALASAIDDADNNDYCYIQVPVSESAPTEIAQVDRYKFNGTTWAYEYTLNNSGFTADQWAALNSAITSGLVAKLSALPNMAELTALLAGKQNLLNFDTAPTTGSSNPVTSGGVKTAIDDEKTRAQAAEQTNNLLITQINGKIPSDATSENKLVDKAYVDAVDATMQSAIEGILALIPEAATALNQLADKAFVNSSIATNTGTFKGTYNVVLDLELFYDATHAQIALMLASKITSAKNNDYCYVQVPNSNEDPTSINHTDRYKYNGTAWAYEYTLNNSGYTSDQWGAINSGITSALVTSLTNLLNNLVPSTATAQNKLADQAYVIAAIVAAIPACKGTFTTLSDLEAVASPKAGDLGIVRTTDSNGYAVYTFYQYINNAWTVFFEINHQLINKPASDNTELATFDNGMGKYEIPKHIVNIGTELEPIYQNQLYQSDFQVNGSARTNTIYVIKYDFTLTENITIPANCVLQFDGGSISGSYTLTGANTGIQAGLVKIFNTDVTFAGSWNLKKIWANWFNAASDTAMFQKAFDVANTIAGERVVSVTCATKTYEINDTLFISWNTSFDGNGCVLIPKSGLHNKYMFSCNSSNTDGWDIAYPNNDRVHIGNFLADGRNDEHGAYLIYSADSRRIHDIKTFFFAKVIVYSDYYLDNRVIERVLDAYRTENIDYTSEIKEKNTVSVRVGEGDNLSIRNCAFSLYIENLANVYIESFMGFVSIVNASNVAITNAHTESDIFLHVYGSSNVSVKGYYGWARQDGEPIVKGMSYWSIRPIIVLEDFYVYKLSALGENYHTYKPISGECNFIFKNVYGVLSSSSSFENDRGVGMSVALPHPYRDGFYMDGNFSVSNNNIFVEYQRISRLSKFVADNIGTTFYARISYLCPKTYMCFEQYIIGLGSTSESIHIYTGDNPTMFHKGFLLRIEFSADGTNYTHHFDIITVNSRCLTSLYLEKTNNGYSVENIPAKEITYMQDHYVQVDKVSFVNDIVIAELNASQTNIPLYTANLLPANSKLITSEGVVLVKNITSDSLRADGHLTGTTENRPTILIRQGLMYYDTTLNKPIWYNGSAWVDATGATV